MLNRGLSADIVWGQREVWGILGGMGPLASARFMQTIYEKGLERPEQDGPIVVLLSDPTVPDRSDACIRGKQREILRHFTHNVEHLLASGVTKIVVCCFTIHPLIPMLPFDFQSRITSLVDIAFQALLRSRDKHLLLCTQGSRLLGIFEHHPLWPETQEHIVLPSVVDQREIHKLIYTIKRHPVTEYHFRLIERLMARYDVNSCIAGCTEMHILATASAVHGERLCVLDPLDLLAAEISAV